MLGDLVRTDFKLVDKRDPISTIYGYLKGQAKGLPIIADRERPYGVLNENGLLGRRLDPDQRIERFAIGVRPLDVREAPARALRHLAASRVAYAPVLDGERLLGYAKVVDLLAWVDPGSSADELATEVPLARKEDSVGDIVHRMSDAGVPALPVTEGGGRVAGVVRRDDLVRLLMDARPDGRKAAGGEREDVRASRIAGLLDGHYATLPPSADFDRVREALQGFGFAVVDGATPRLLTPEGVLGHVAEA